MLFLLLLSLNSLQKRLVDCVSGPKSHRTFVHFENIAWNAFKSFSGSSVECTSYNVGDLFRRPMLSFHQPNWSPHPSCKANVSDKYLDNLPFPIQHNILSAIFLYTNFSTCFHLTATTIYPISQFAFDHPWWKSTLVQICVVENFATL